MRKLLFFVFILFGFLTLISECKFNFNTAVRSGEINNDDVGEPIPFFAKKFEPALNTSNAILENLKTNNINTVFNNYVHPDYKDIMSIQILTNLIDSVKKPVGAIKSYKTDQWGFIPQKEGDKDLLYSVKIVQHEKQTLHYFFVFLNDSKYDKIIGLHIKDRKGVRQAKDF